MITRSVIRVLLGAVLLASCTFVEPTADELVGYLDRLEFGPEWRLISEEVAERPCEQITDACPRAVRIYRVEATEFPSSVSILEEAGLETQALFQSCIDDPEVQCTALGWDEDVAINMTIASDHGSELEVQVRAVKRVGPSPTD